jgi:hypothetical protein
MSDASLLTIKALGRQATIGTLYNIRKEEF